MSDAIILGLIGVFLAIITAIVAPAVMLVLRARTDADVKLAEARAKQLEREQDEERQDRRALAVQAVAERLVESNRSIAVTAAEATRITTEQLKDIKTDVQIVHTLVNSNLTVSNKATLTALEALLVSLVRNVDLDRLLGNEPSVEALAEIEAVRSTISEMRFAIGVRVQQTAAADAQAQPPKV